jgi:hypothetical protein
MMTVKAEAKGSSIPMFEGLLPIKGSQVPAEIVAGITLAPAA